MTGRIVQISDLRRAFRASSKPCWTTCGPHVPSLVAVCGGLTQRAAEREFRSARAFLDRLSALPATAAWWGSTPTARH